MNRDRVIFDNLKLSASATRQHLTVCIKARVDALRAARWTRLQMTGDEALARVALDARADPRERTLLGR